MSFKHLFEPINIRDTQLKNRAVMGAMHTNLEETNNGFTKVAAFYQERAKGGVGLIISGGISPNASGILAPERSIMATDKDVENHQLITRAVHQFDCKICMQILHAGRYAYHVGQVAPSPLQAPISPYYPRELSKDEIEQQIDDFAHSAVLAEKAGYDGVEIMGSEGYLINQFLVKATNKRTDQWGGCFDNRIRFALEIVKRIRGAVGEQFIIIFRLSMIDLIEEGSTASEVIQLAKALEKEKVDLINMGVGWHESRIPTIASSVPRAAFVELSRNLKEHVSTPLIASNRINTPEVAEQILSDGVSDMVSMARPFLADSQFMNKAKEGRSCEINTCIACNQSCLDRIFRQDTASCLVNPRACNETKVAFIPAVKKKKLAVVGAGPAGMAFSKYAAKRGHQVTLFESSNKIGGQFKLASQVPGKSEFTETLRYFSNRLPRLGVKIVLNKLVSAGDLEGFDEVIIATGVVPRVPDIPGIENNKVIGYKAVLSGQAKIGERVAIIGGGGIGFDVAMFLADQPMEELSSQQDFVNEWGIDLSVNTPGGITSKTVSPSARSITMLQRGLRKPGADLGITTSWIHRQHLKNKQVKMTVGVTYQKIDELGLHILVRGRPRLLEVDHIVNCSGQLENTNLINELAHKTVHVIGGAKKAAGINAERAIAEAAELAQLL